MLGVIVLFVISFIRLFLKMIICTPFVALRYSASADDKLTVYCICDGQSVIHPPIVPKLPGNKMKKQKKD